MKLAGRLTTVVLGLLAAWLSGVQPASAVEFEGAPSMVAYAYDSRAHAAAPTYTTTERGPPGVVATDTAYDGVDLGSHATWAGPDTSWAGAITTYDYPDLLAQAARATCTPSRPLQEDEGTTSASQPKHIAANNVPTVTFSRSRAPGIAQNFDNAVANGAPTSLTRVGDATRRANRRAALRGQPRAPAGQSLDEYPFACSAQGGCGSFVRSVPIGEQNYQGGVLSRFFQDYGVNPGDPFNVRFGP